MTSHYAGLLQALPLIHKYMTDHYAVLLQVFQLTIFMGHIYPLSEAKWPCKFFSKYK
jgi:hypothetical protein